MSAESDALFCFVSLSVLALLLSFFYRSACKLCSKEKFEQKCSFRAELVKTLA